MNDKELCSCLRDGYGSRAENDAAARIEALLAERDALAKQTCEECASQWQMPNGHLCGKVSHTSDSVARVLCSMLGGGCRAWEERRGRQ